MQSLVVNSTEDESTSSQLVPGVVNSDLLSRETNSIPLLLNILVTLLDLFLFFSKYGSRHFLVNEKDLCYRKKTISTSAITLSSC